jgi:hypothetical protein
MVIVWRVLVDFLSHAAHVCVCAHAMLMVCVVLLTDDENLSAISVKGLQHLARNR